MTTPLTQVFLAGIGSSEYDHWQSIWFRQTERAVWVEQNWESPVRDEWVDALVRALRAIEGKALLVAHSLGCILAAEVGDRAEELGIGGAFLVAVPDVEGPAFPAVATGFRPARTLRLQIPSMVIASANDPYGSIEHAQRVAEHWSSEFVSVGSQGHINLESNLGDWPAGRALLQRFAASI